MFERRRQEMVQECLIKAGIEDKKVLAAMGKVPRHLFVDPAMAHQAYQCKSLPIGNGQTISHPTTVAYMTQTLELTGTERVLEIGTGSGYQAAVLAEMGVKVYSIERIAALARRAQELFDRLGYYTIAVRIGDGSLGWTQYAPYDRILVTAASPQIPEPLFNQLHEGGQMIAPVGEKNDQKLLVITKKENKVHILKSYSRSFVPLIGREGWDF